MQEGQILILQVRISEEMPVCWLQEYVLHVLLQGLWGRLQTPHPYGETEEKA